MRIESSDSLFWIPNNDGSHHAKPNGSVFSKVYKMQILGILFYCGYLYYIFSIVLIVSEK